MNSKTENHNDNPTLLLSQCRRGESSALKKLYLLYIKAMLNISMRIVNNKDEAEDVLQECFLKAFQNIHQFESEKDFAAWLKRVVVNRSIDILRKQKKENILYFDEVADIEDEAEEENVVYDIETVRSCVQQLPDGYRIVLTLFLFEDYSHSDIATLLNISEGTSKSQYSRAKNKLITLIKAKTLSHV